MTTEVIEAPTLQDAEPGDHDKFSHYASKADIMRAMVEGVEIQALCGKMWLPTEFSGEKFPVCPTCIEIMAQIPQ